MLTYLTTDANNFESRCGYKFLHTFRIPGPIHSSQIFGAFEEDSTWGESIEGREGSLMSDGLFVCQTDTIDKVKSSEVISCLIFDSVFKREAAKRGFKSRWFVDERSKANLFEDGFPSQKPAITDRAAVRREALISSKHPSPVSGDDNTAGLQFDGGEMEIFIHAALSPSLRSVVERAA